MSSSRRDNVGPQVNGVDNSVRPQMHDSTDKDEEGMAEEENMQHEPDDEDDELFGPDLNREAVWARL